MASRSVNAKETLMRFSILALIWILSFSIRVFSVVRNEDDYDLYFNFRATSYLEKEGFYDFMNWVDSRTWYPFGRLVGQTVYPGLMATAALFQWFFTYLGLPINLRNTCVFLSPAFSGATACSTFLLTAEVADSSAGLLAAAFIGIAPSYASTSAGGSYDNDGIAIFALVTSFYLLIKAVKTGSLCWAASCCFAYFYMVTSCAAYAILINIIPLYVLTMCVIGRFSMRLYIAYSVFYVLGTFLSMQVFMVNFQAVQTAEHFPAMGIFALLQVLAGMSWANELVGAWPPSDAGELREARGIGEIEQRRVELWWGRWRTRLLGVALVLGGLAVWIQVSSFGGGHAARSWAVADGGLPWRRAGLAGSAWEHEWSTWAAYFSQLHLVVPMTPVGLYFCLERLSDAKVLVIVYAMAAAYLSGFMVRIMVMLCPALCVCAGMGVSAVLKARLRDLASPLRLPASSRNTRPRLPQSIALLAVGAVGWLLLLYVQHAVWYSSQSSSAPALAPPPGAADGSRAVQQEYRDDYLAACRWMAHNLPPHTRVLAAWHHGYPLAALANPRLALDHDDEHPVTLFVDSRPWNKTHLAAVNSILTASEEQAWELMQRYHVDYVVVVLGGAAGYGSDDVARLQAAGRLGAGEGEASRSGDGGGRGGEEHMYRVGNDDAYRGGQVRIDGDGSETLQSALVYKLAYHRLGQFPAQVGKVAAWERVRSEQGGARDAPLDYLDEVFTSEHCLMRIYSLRRCAPPHPSPDCNRRPLAHSRGGAARRPCYLAGECLECGASQESRGEYRGHECVPVRDARLASTCEPRGRADKDALHLDKPCLAKLKRRRAARSASAAPARGGRAAQRKRAGAAKAASGGGGRLATRLWCGDACLGAPRAAGGKGKASKGASRGAPAPKPKKGPTRTGKSAPSGGAGGASGGGGRGAATG